MNQNNTQSIIEEIFSIAIGNGQDLRRFTNKWKISIKVDFEYDYYVEISSYEQALEIVDHIEQEESSPKFKEFLESIYTPDKTNYLMYSKVILEQ